MGYVLRVAEEERLLVAIFLEITKVFYWSLKSLG